MGKIIKNGIDYGGGVAIDSALSTTSMNAIANKPVAEAITQLNNDLAYKQAKITTAHRSIGISTQTSYAATGLNITIPAHTAAIIHAEAVYTYNQPSCVGINIGSGGSKKWAVGVYNADTGLCVVDTSIVNISDSELTAFVFAKHVTSGSGQASYDVIFIPIA